MVVTTRGDMKTEEIAFVAGVLEGERAPYGTNRSASFFISFLEEQNPGYRIVDN
jgi:hypothetical protein